MTFKEWSDQQDEDEELAREDAENAEAYQRVRKRFRENAMINALAVFFPDMPELEGRVLWGATEY